MAPGKTESSLGCCSRAYFGRIHGASRKGLSVPCRCAVHLAPAPACRTIGNTNLVRKRRELVRSEWWFESGQRQRWRTLARSRNIGASPGVYDMLYSTFGTCRGPRGSLDAEIVRAREQTSRSERAYESARTQQRAQGQTRRPRLYADCLPRAKHT